MKAPTRLSISSTGISRWTIQTTRKSHRVQPLHVPHRKSPLKRIQCQSKQEQEASLRKSLLKRIHCQEKQVSFLSCSTIWKKDVNISRQFQFQCKQSERNSKQSETAHKGKKGSDTHGTVYRSSLDAVLQVRKEANFSGDVSAENLQHTPAIGVIYGLNQSTAQTFNNGATWISQEHRQPLLNCLLNGFCQIQGKQYDWWAGSWKPVRL